MIYICKVRPYPSEIHTNISVIPTSIIDWAEILLKFEKALKEYYAAGRGKEGMPAVAYFAKLAHLTPGYFGDLIKNLTGRTAQEMIALHIVEIAKNLLASTFNDISEIAYELGFQYPQHFSRMFKKVTGISPTLFRKNRAIKTLSSVS